ncbi:cellulose biosynthesis cyclic di-GMP-binding regulatory protein BcsB [Lacibacterium aquatile]|uniref:Cyclic di-GMP-binding protein n=1 Tax=Lacibacterium aquatile TaxID=1168082 RepID=A0ABW5DXA4_9PROT
MASARRTAILATALAALCGMAHADTIRLADLGYADGALLTASQTAAEVFFPLPARASDGRLRFDAQTSGLLPPGAMLTVRVGGIPLATVQLDQTARSRLSVEIPAESLQADYARVEFNVDLPGGIGNCGVAESAASWVRISGDSTFDVERGAGALPLPGELWRRAVGDIRVGIPAEPTLAQSEAALEIYGALRRRGARPQFVDLPDSITAGNAPDILIAGAREPTTVVASSARAGASLQISSPEAARALILLPEVQSAELALDSALARGVAPDANKVTLAALGYRERTARLQARTVETITIPVHRLPQGRLPRAVVLFGQGSELSAQEIVVADVYIDGAFVDSFALRDEFGLDGRRIELPGDLVSDGGRLEIRLRHLARAGQCSQGASFQLRGTSYLELTDQRVDAYDLRHLFISPDGQAHVAVQPEYANRLREFLPVIAQLIDDRAGPGASISVVEGAPTTGIDRGPTIWFGRMPPADLAGAPVQFGRGRVDIALPDGQGTLSLAQPVEASVVQLVQTPRRQAVWIYPGAPGSARVAGGIDGTVTVLDGVRATAVDTKSERRSVEYPEQLTFQDQLTLYRTELFVLGWLLLSALALFIVLRLRRGEVR